MANEININASRTQLQGSALEQAARLAGDLTKAKEIVGKAVEILAGTNVKVTRGDDASATGAGERKTSGATNVPVLDNPDDAKALEADLARLIAYLQLDNEERQTAMAKDRIEMQKSSLDTEHKSRMKEIDDSIQKMRDAEKAATVNRIFGWIGAILAVAAAAVLTVVTGGAAAGFAIAGAAIAVTSLVLNETGVMDKLTEKLAEHLQQEYGMSKSDAQLAASLIINLTIMAASLACSVGGMVAGFTSVASAASSAASAGANAVKTVSQTAKTVQNVVTIANTAVGAGALAAGGVSTALTKRSEDAKADVMELEKFITMIQQQLEESEEELQKLLQMIQSAIGDIASLISSSTDTSKEIAEKIGGMV